MGAIERVQSTTDALKDAKEESEPRKALKMFAALLGVPTHVVSRPKRYSETTGKVIEVKWETCEVYGGRLPDCALTSWLKEQLQPKESALIDGLLIHYEPEHHWTSRGMMGHEEDYWTAAHFVISRPKIIEDRDGT